MASTCMMTADTITRFPSQITVQSSLIPKSLKKNVRVTKFYGHVTPSLISNKKEFLSGNTSLLDKGLGTSGLTYNLSRKFAITGKAEASYNSGGESDGVLESLPSSNHAFTTQGDDTSSEPSMIKVKIGVYFATWWALNVVFNIYNKKVLNAYPYPWLTSTLSLAAGSLIMVASWITGIAKAPDVDLDFWKALAPVSCI